MDKNPLVRVRRTSLDFCPCPLPVPGSLEFPAPKPQILAPGLNLLADFFTKKEALKSASDIRSIFKFDPDD